MLSAKLIVLLIVPIVSLLTGISASTVKPPGIARIDASGANYASVLDTLRVGYDKRVRPNHGGDPVQVAVTMFVINVFGISDNNRDFTMDIYFRQSWNDPRLKFSDAAGINRINAGTDLVRTIWVPDTFFPNAKNTYFHTATVNNEFLRIFANGDVKRSFRLSVTASCDMDLSNFPMDSQVCALQIESFGSLASEIQYVWEKGEDSVQISDDITLPLWEVLGHRQQTEVVSLTTGNYSRMSCELYFERQYGNFILQLYIPLIWIVLLSWVSFWIDRTATIARIAIGLATILFTLLLISIVDSAIPNVPYIKAVDVYVGTCFVLVFATILEYATVAYMTKKLEMRNKADSENVVTKVLGVAPGDLDKYSRIVFPVLFIVFNLLYWIIYLNIGDIVEDDVILID